MYLKGTQHLELTFKIGNKKNCVNLKGYVNSNFSENS